MGIKILKLAQIADKRKPRTDNRPQLLKGEVAPTTGLEALLWIGGLMSNGKAYPLNLEHEAPAYIFGSRSVNMLLRETDMVVRLLDGLIEAFPENDTTGVDLATWTAEIQALWALLTLYKQRQVAPELAADAQLLSQVIKVIGDKGNERSFQDGGYGRQLQTGRAQPRSVIDALRWVSGYFGREHN
jgi:hypothetical protein